VSRLCYRCPKRTPFSVAILVIVCLQGAGGKRHSFSPVAPVCYRPTRSMHSSSTFRRRSLCPLRPHSAISGANLCRTPLLICAAGAHEGDGAMEITIHKHLIEQCVMMACASKAGRDNPFGSPWLSPGGGWLTRWSDPKWRTLPPVGNTGIDERQLWRVNSLSLATRFPLACKRDRKGVVTSG